MKSLIPFVLLLFAMPLHSSPMAETLQLVGSVELSQVKYELVLEAKFTTEKAHTIQYTGMAKMISGSDYLERPMTLYVTKRKPQARMIINILMSGSAKYEGLYLELVVENASRNYDVGDLVTADAELMWLIRSPYRDFTETTFLTRDRGQAQLEVLEVH